MKPNWNPRHGASFETKNIHGTTLICEYVSFIPDVTINCHPPYIQGKPDGGWVKYLKGKRPTDKMGWQSELGMRLQTML